MKSFFGALHIPNQKRYSNDTLFMHMVCELLFEEGFIREYTVVYDVSGSRYRMDFAHPLKMINVEIDGANHEGGSQQQSDLRRDKILLDLGWTIARVHRRKSVDRSVFDGSTPGPHWEISTPASPRYPRKSLRIRRILAPLCL